MPRLDSAEMKRVKDSFRREVEQRTPTSRTSSPQRVDSDRPQVADSVPPVSTRPRLRDSVRREDPEDEDSPSSNSNSNSSSSLSERIPHSVERTSRNPPERMSRNPPAATNSSRPSQGPRRATASWEAESPTGTRRKRSGRPPVTVDEVGVAAVKLARTTRRQDSAPKLVASRGMVSKAPIDTRAAFVLSLIDGRNTVDAIVDMSGMNEDEVKAILDRLARLGLISLPA
jgi:hypothetical protein